MLQELRLQSWILDAGEDLGVQDGESSIEHGIGYFYRQCRDEESTLYPCAAFAHDGADFLHAFLLDLFQVRDGFAFFAECHGAAVDVFPDSVGLHVLHGAVIDQGANGRSAEESMRCQAAGSEAQLIGAGSDLPHANRLQ